MKKILIVDDDDSFRAMLGDILAEEGFLTIEAPDGVTAIGNFLLHQPDAVILDYQMPNVNGLETLRHIKQLSPKVPIIIVTGMTGSVVAFQAFLGGADDVMFKPPEFRELIEKVKKALVVAA